MKQASTMIDLPNDSRPREFRRRKIKDVGTVVTGGTPPGHRHGMYGSDVPFITPSDLDSEASPKRSLSSAGAQTVRVVPEGSALVCCIGSIGKMGVAKADSAFNQQINAVVWGSEIDPNYGMYALRSIHAELTSAATSTTIPILKKSTFQELEIVAPSLPEQRRIAAILDQADELRTKRRRTLTLLDELADSLFAYMFGGAFAQGELEIRRLDQVTDVDDRINYGVVQPGDGVIDGIPLIRVGDLRLGGIRDGSLKQISNDIEKEYVRSRIRGTEILVSCVGSIGEVSTVSVEHIGFNVARAVARVPIADTVQRAYVAAALRSSPIQAYFKNETRTVSQPTLNIKQLAGTPIPWPKRPDMSVFQDRISKLRTAQRGGRQHDAQLDELFASLQHRAFRGEL